MQPFYLKFSTKVYVKFQYILRLLKVKVAVGFDLVIVHTAQYMKKCCSNYIVLLLSDRCFFDVLQASKRNLVYPHYAWIIYSIYPDKWWTEEVANETLECSDQELEEFLLKSHALTIHLVPEPDDWNHLTAAGLVK